MSDVEAAVPPAQSDHNIISSQDAPLQDSHVDGRFFSNLQHLPAPRKWIFIGVIILLGAAASAAFTSIGIAARKAEDEENYRHEAEELSHSIQLAMDEYDLFGLWVHQSCFRSSERQSHIDPSVDIEGYIGMCSREEFSNLYIHLESRTEIKFQSVQFLPKIWADERYELERQSRNYYQDNYPDFSYQGITDPKISPENVLEINPRSNSSFYWPVHYIEPLKTNEAAVELDGYADAGRAAQIDKTVNFFKPTLSGGIRLVQEKDPNALGIILRHPGIPENTLKPAEPLFLTQMVIRVPDMLTRASSDVPHSKAVYLFDSTQSTRDPQFLGAVEVWVSGDERERAILPKTYLSDIPRPRRSFMFTYQIQVADRTWTCAIVSHSEAPSLVYIILGGVIIFMTSVMLALWYYTHMSRLAKFSALQTQAEAEKAESAQIRALKEREMTEFVAHEVKNPLSSAISALSFVSSTVADPDQCSVSNYDTRDTLNQDLRVMDASLQYINDLLRGILEVHRSSNREIELIMKPTDIQQDILEPIKSILGTRGTPNSVEIQVDCPNDLVCLTDRMRLKQILLNLSLNSVKFVQKGFIRLRATTVNGHVELSVEDSGPSIPMSKRKNLFSKYQQSLDSLSQGTGLGLSLCKKLSDLLGADIWLDESFDSGIKGCIGTRFVIQIHQPPISLDASLQEGGRDTEEGVPSESGSLLSDEYVLPESLSVLFVDDDLILRRMFVRSLKRTCPGWCICEASNGETALRLAESSHFDVIFMDHYMASFERQLLGTETVRALRANGVESLICGLSANDKEQDFKEAGADAFLFKPFPCEKDALSRELSRVLRIRESGPKE